MSDRRVVLFSKPDCHLCQEALRELETLRARYPHQLEVVDITTDPVLMQAYGERIPVVQVGRREYAAPLTPSMLERALRAG